MKDEYEAIKRRLKGSVPPEFDVLVLGNALNGLYDVLHKLKVGVTLSIPDLPAPELIRELPHYDVVLVSPVLHKQKNWYEYLEAILNAADIAIFETPFPLPNRYAIGLNKELTRVGETLLVTDDITLWAVDRRVVRGEEEQIAMLSEILRGFDANTNDEHFHVSDGDTEAIAGALVEALKFHGYRLVYDPSITVANLNQVVAVTPVPQQAAEYEPQKLDD